MILRRLRQGFVRAFQQGTCQGHSHFFKIGKGQQGHSRALAPGCDQHPRPGHTNRIQVMHNRHHVGPLPAPQGGRHLRRSIPPPEGEPNGLPFRQIRRTADAAPHVVPKAVQVDHHTFWFGTVQMPYLQDAPFTPFHTRLRPLCTGHEQPSSHLLAIGLRALGNRGVEQHGRQHPETCDETGCAPHEKDRC